MKMKISLLLLFMFALIVIFAKSNVEGRLLENKQSNYVYCLHRVRGRRCRVNDNNLGYEKKVVGDSSLSNVFGATKNANDNTNKNVKNKYDKYSGDPLSYAQEMSDSHHQTSIEDYRKMSHDIPKHP
ncbi:hypothetical protein Cni_G18626 [Canna indica]|uniref:Uncharacterized protein n=1 Tax=Canna indica TaxID=4628 RepID=A0AAQ3KJ72_9LILI|nr:hypothetical protein Cni_G18626 [Canna indica]